MKMGLKYKLLFFLSMLALGGAIKCYKCSGGTLEQCKQTTVKCKNFHNRCMSLLLEGGNVDKMYHKDCGTSGGCGLESLEKKCVQKKSIFRIGSCRASCCSTDQCNHSNRYSASWVTMITLLAIAVRFLQ